MAAYNDQCRLATSQALAVASAGGAVTSSAAFGIQTKRIRVCFPGSTSSTGGCRYTVVDPAWQHHQSLARFCRPTGSRLSR
jgi:hypothetical protein